MRSSVRWIVIGASVLVLVVLFVLLRPGSGSDGRATPSGSASSGPIVIEVTVRDGAVDAPAMPTVTQGDHVRIVVQADVTDEVHLHGYDLHADVTPTSPATIDLVATTAGVFESELEDAGELLFRLEVVP